jgi:hypothetical protein
MAFVYGPTQVAVLAGFGYGLMDFHVCGYLGWLDQAIIICHCHPANLQGKTACNQKGASFLLWL